MPEKILIAGGGIGGLCLAQGLKKAGIDVAVFERDASVAGRGQGYRFRIDSDGDTALRQCLPPPLYKLYQATANRPSDPPLGAFDYRLNLIYQLPRGGAQWHMAVNRYTLRQILLGGLEDIVHFDHALVDFEQRDERITAHFTNGKSVTGDVLVAADGIHSVVRSRLLPHAEMLDTGMRCIYGRTLLDSEVLEWLPEVLQGGFIPVLGPERCTLALGMYRSCRPFEEAIAEFAPGVRLDKVHDYLMWMFVTPQERCPRSADPTVLHDFVVEQLAEWHPDLRRVLAMADIASTFPVSIRTSRPVSPWPAQRVTLLGDAIHAMTPAGGIGANTALRDAALLTQCLTMAARREDGLIDAIARYETTMRDYGFTAVERSLGGAAQLYRITLPAQESAR